MIPYIVRTNAVSLFPADSAPINIDGTHPNFKAVVDAITAGNFDEAIKLANVKTFITTASKGAVEVNDQGVFYKGQPFNNYLTGVMMEFFEKGLPLDHYLLFVENLMSNPSRTAVEELYLFLEGARLPITEDGCFLAYKAVRSDFKDKHSGKFDNSPGAVLSMERNAVDDNRERTCSYGFHAAAYEYARNFLGSYGDRMVAVKINPRDVVAVPADYNNQKLRTCRYEVLYEIEGAFDTLTGTTHVSVTKDTDPENNWWESYDDPEVDLKSEVEAAVEAAVDACVQDFTDEVVSAVLHRLNK